MTEAVNNYAASGVQKLDGVGGAGSTGNIQLIFAQLQMELAKTNKESALDKIEQIREAQAESAAITAAINALRNLKSEMGNVCWKICWMSFHRMNWGLHWILIGYRLPGQM